jgi:prepilin-type N-terminal cleavage/methylation domain-containing protein
MRGFSLLELLLAVAIFSITSYAITVMLIDAGVSTRVSQERTIALSYAKEGIEATRSIRDFSWDLLTIGEHGLDNSGATSTFIDEFDSIDDKYIRIISISDIEPVNPSVKNVSVAVGWEASPDRIVSVVLDTIFTNWKDN